MNDQTDEKEAQIDMCVEHPCRIIEIAEKANPKKKMKVRKTEDKMNDQEMEATPCQENKEHKVGGPWLTNYNELKEYK